MTGCVSLGTLTTGRLYRAPSGRLCCLVPPPKSGPGSKGGYFRFAYVPGPLVPGLRALSGLEAFTLAPSNVGLLREVGA